MRTTDRTPRALTAADILLHCQSVTPLPAQIAILQEAMAALRADGFFLPGFNVHWRRGYGDICNAAVSFHPESARIDVHLNANAPSWELRRAVHAQLRRVWDVAFGGRAS